jgi:hypothetical protein
MIGQMILHHCVATVEQVGHTHEFNRVFHTLSKVGILRCNGPHIEHGRPDEGRHIFRIQLQGPGKGRPTPVDLTKLIGTNRQADTGRGPAADGKTPHGRPVFRQRPLVILLRQEDRRHAQESGQDESALLLGGLKEKARLIQAPAFQIEHTATNPRHGEKGIHLPRLREACIGRRPIGVTARAATVVVALGTPARRRQ